MAKMSASTLKAMLKSELETGLGVFAGELATQRSKAIDYYYGKPFGNEVDGRSQVVLSDVSDTIEWALPQLLKPFVAGEQMGRFEPQGPEDEESARQATDYVNFILNHDNNSFTLLYQWFKDALLNKNGFIKVYWETKEKVETETYSGLSDDEAASVLENYGRDGKIEILEHAQDVDDLGMSTHDIKLTRTTKKGYVCVENVPPEDVVVSKRATSNDDLPFIAHLRPLTRSDLIEMGFSRSQVDDLSASVGEGRWMNPEFTSRHDFDETVGMDSAFEDKSREIIRIAECYLKIDWDDDGVSEWRRIIYAQDDDEVLENKPIDDHPFVTTTPVLMPHKFFGISMADLTMDIQLIRSTVLRQVLDNMYGLNNNRHFVDYTRVEMDDLLTNRPDLPIRVEGPVGDAVRTFPIQPLGPYAFPIMEWMNQEKESRTGVNRYIQGMDPNSLNKTAHGMSLMTQAAAQRLELIDRVFANSVAVLFRKILKIITRHQDKPRMIRLRNAFVPMDPRTWNSEMDVTIEVGIGYGSKELQNAMLDQFLTYQFEIVKMQGGLSGPLVTGPNVYNTLMKKAEAAGLKTAAPYFTDPNSPEGQQATQVQAQRPDPEMAKVQLEAKKSEATMQMDQQKAQAQLQLEQGKAVANLQLEREKAQAEHVLAMERMKGEFALKQEQMRLEHGLKTEQAAIDVLTQQQSQQAQLGMQREKQGAEIGLAREKMNGEQRIKAAETLMTRPEGEEGSTEPVKTPLDDLVEALARQSQDTNKMLSTILTVVKEQSEATDALLAAASAPITVSKTADGFRVTKQRLN